MEIWKTIEKYPDYQISNLGNVKSLKFEKEKILKQWIDDLGYCRVDLIKNEKVHQLVAIAFLNHNPCKYKLVINHKNFNRQDNRVENLEIVTQRENANKAHIKSSSKYVGVSWHKGSKKWMSRIVINGKRKHLGYFFEEIEASNAYQNALLAIRVL